MQLNHLLTRKQVEAGLTLHDDEDMVYLHYGENLLAIWSATSVIPATIQVEAQHILHNWAKRENTAKFCELQAQSA